ncbi:MAG: RnfABCDGE type electron transport complex subunit G [Calditrichia bacterium]
MGRIFRLSLILALVGMVSATALGLLYSKTKPRIEEMKRYKTLDALKVVLPDAGDIVPVTKTEPILDPQGKQVAEKQIIEYYIGYKDDSHKEIVGYAIKATEKGYEALVETMVGVNPDGSIRKIKVLAQKETPGLGARCTEDDPVNPNKKKWTTEQFVGKTVTDLKVDKDGGTIVSITGATITSRTITNSIKKALTEFLPKIESKQVAVTDSLQNGGE